jgi:hypothetical protein
VIKAISNPRWCFRLGFQIPKWHLDLETTSNIKHQLGFQILLKSHQIYSVSQNNEPFQIQISYNVLYSVQWRNYYGLRPGEPGGPQPQWAKWGPPGLGDRAKTLARVSDMLQCRFLTIRIL